MSELHDYPEETEVTIAFPPGFSHRRFRINIGDRSWRFVAFDEGQLRVFGVAQMEPVAAHSFVLHQFRSAAARRMELEESGWLPPAVGFPDDPYLRVPPALADSSAPALVDADEQRVRSRMEQFAQDWPDEQPAT